MYDREVQSFHETLLVNKPNPVHHELRKEFLERIDKWIHEHEMIKFRGLETFERRDAIVGVTQTLDELHMLHPDLVMTKDDYRYHMRLRPDIRTVDARTITEDDVLVLSVPHPFWGWHGDTYKLIEKCKEVHIDAAYYGCSRDIDFDVTHPKIKSVSVSLSKAFGMGVHRVGIRYTRERINGPIAIMNDFEYMNVSDMWTGIQFMDHFGTDFWWKKYEDTYNEILDENNLDPHNSIHIAWDGEATVGVRAELRKKMEGYDDSAKQNW